jgi:hypothetical protein
MYAENAEYYENAKKNNPYQESINRASDEANDVLASAGRIEGEASRPTETDDVMASAGRFILM